MQGVSQSKFESPRESDRVAPSSPPGVHDAVLDPRSHHGGRLESLARLIIPEEEWVDMIVLHDGGDVLPGEGLMRQKVGGDADQQGALGEEAEAEDGNTEERRATTGR